MSRQIVQIKNLYADAWHYEGKTGTLCNSTAKTKPITAITPFVTCAKCRKKAGERVPGQGTRQAASVA